MKFRKSQIMTFMNFQDSFQIAIFNVQGNVWYTFMFDKMQMRTATYTPYRDILR